MLLTRHEARLTKLLYTEIFFSSLPAAVIAFNGAYVLRLGGSSLDVSLLTALPALAAALLSVPVGAFLQGRANPHRWVLACLGLYWTGFFLLAFVPWVRLPGVPPASVAVAVLGLFSLPTQIFNVGIYALLQDLTSERNRVHVFAARAIINASMMSGLTLLIGQWLERVDFPRNYQLAYGFSFLGGLVGVGLLTYASRLPRLRPVPTSAASTAPAARPALIPRDIARHTDFIHITVNTLLHGLAIWLAAPLFTLYFVRQLGAGDAWLGLYATVTSLFTIGGLFFWRWVVKRWRVDRTLRATVWCVGIMPLLVGLVPNLTFMLGMGAFYGFMSAGLTVSHINVVLPTLPEDRRQQFFGLYAALLNIGAFAAPLVAVGVADQIGLGAALAGCGVIGLVGAASHWIWRVPGRARGPVAAPQPEVGTF